MRKTDLITKVILIWIIAALASGIIAVGLESFAEGTKQQAVQEYQDQLSETRYTCMQSNRLVSGTLEERCTQLQDQTDTEFICDVMGRCWLEWHGYPSEPLEPLTASYKSL